MAYILTNNRASALTIPVNSRYVPTTEINQAMPTTFPLSIAHIHEEDGQTGVPVGIKFPDPTTLFEQQVAMLERTYSENSVYTNVLDSSYFGASAKQELFESREQNYLVEWMRLLQLEQEVRGHHKENEPRDMELASEIWAISKLLKQFPYSYYKEEDAETIPPLVDQRTGRRQTMLRKEDRIVEQVDNLRVRALQREIRRVEQSLLYVTAGTEKQKELQRTLRGLIERRYQSSPF